MLLVFGVWLKFVISATENCHLLFKYKNYVSVNKTKWIDLQGMATDMATAFILPDTKYFENLYPCLP